MKREVLGNMTEGMRAFAERYSISLTDPDLKRMYDLEMSAKRDRASAMYNARNEGRAEVIRSLLANGVPLEVIYRSSGVPRAEIDSIIAGME